MTKWQWLAGVVGLVIVGGTVWAGEGSEAAQAHRQRAAVYESQEQWVEAAVELRSALQLEPGKKEDHRALARMYLRLDDPTSALQELQALAGLAPDDGEARLQMAALFLLGKNFSDALEQATRATELLPERFEGHALVGRARAGLEDRSGALAAFERAVQLAPENELLRVELARLYVADEQPEAAASRLREGLAAVPPSVTLRVALANLLARQGQTQEADRWMGEVENLSLGNPGAAKAAAAYRLKRGDAPAAEALLRKVLADAGDNAPARLQALDELANFYSLTGELEKARDALVQVQALAPEDARTLARLANLYLLEGDDRAAAPVVQALAGLAPTDPNVQLLQARFDIAQGRLLEGTATLEEIVREIPDSINAHLFLGKAYAMARRWEPARGAYLKVLEEVPGHYFALLDLAKVNVELGRFDAALERTGQVLKVRPGDPTAQRVRARALLASGQAVAAEGELRTLLQTYGEDPGLHLQLSQSLTAQGRYEAALVAVRRARELAPAGVEPLLRELDVLDQLGRGDEMDGVAERFLEQNPAPPAVLNALAAHHLGRGEAAAARAWVLRSLQVDGTAPETRELQGRVALADGDDAAAETAFSGALAADPQRTSSLLLLAGVYESRRRGGEAAELYRRVLAYAPGHPIAANNLAVLYTTDATRRQEALTLAEQAVAAAPDNPFTRDTLGWVQYHLREFAEAARNVERARTALPEHPEIAYHLGAVYVALGDRREQALQLLREALHAPMEGEWRAAAEQMLRELEASAP